MILKPVLRGLLTYVPAVEKRFVKSTRGTNSARYCYSVWLRHLVMAHENKLASANVPVPAVVAELGPGDLGLALGYRVVPREPYPPEMREARRRVFAACKSDGVAFLEACSPANITSKLDEGVRVIAGQEPATAVLGRAHQKRSLPV